MEETWDIIFAAIEDLMRKQLVSQFFFISLFFRIFCRMFSSWFRILSWKVDYSSWYKAWKLSNWWWRIFKNNWFWNCESLESWKCLRYFWNTWIYGTWSYVQTKSHNGSWLFCSWCYGIWMHEWKKTICRKIKKRN